jgi:hypothetical protein
LTLVSLDFALTQHILRSNANRTSRLRSTGTVSIDGVNVEPNAQGITDVDLTPAQSEAFRNLIADPKAIAKAAAEGVIELPDPETGRRGKPLATGPTLASFVKASK